MIIGVGIGFDVDLAGSSTPIAITIPIPTAMVGGCSCYFRNSFHRRHLCIDPGEQFAQRAHIICSKMSLGLALEDFKR